MDDLTLQPAAAPSVDVAPAPAAEHRFVFDARLAKVYALQLLNLAMNVLTLGIYVFWGRTRIRRYLLRSFSLDGDRLEYAGLGGELFKGFLKSLPLIAPLFIAMTLWDNKQDPWANLLLLPLLYLVAVAQYAALRYRLSRTRWRGIRGKLGGSALKYGGFWLLTLVGNILTLGLAKPLFDRKLFQYRIRHASWGNQPLSYDGKLWPLLKSHWLTLLLAVPTLGISRVWYKATLMRETLGQLSVAGLRIRTSIQGRNLLRLMAGNVGIVLLVFVVLGTIFTALMTTYVITTGQASEFEMLQQAQHQGSGIADLPENLQVLGAIFFLGQLALLLLGLSFAMPWVLYRQVRFMAQHIWIEGDLSTAHVNQSDEALDSSGEGLDSALGLDTGFL